MQKLNCGINERRCASQERHEEKGKIEGKVVAKWKMKGERNVQKDKHKSIQKKRGVEEPGVDDEAGRRPKRKMESEPGSASGVTPAAGNEEPLATTSGDVQMSSAREPKRSGEDIEELEAASKVGVEAVHQ